MAQNQNIGLLGQYLTVNSTANTSTLTNALVVGNTSVNVVINSSSVYVSGSPLSGATNVAAQYAWTNTQSFSNTITFSGAIVSTNTFSANSSVGTSGMVLTSAGAGANVYWSTVSGGGSWTGGSMANAVTFSNVVTFTANLSVNGAIFLGGSNGTVGQVLTSNGTSNAYWSTVSGGGSFTNGSSISVSNLAFTNSGGGSVGVAYSFINTTSNSLDTVFA